MAIVSSVDPVSSTIIRSTQGATLSRQRAMLRASFLTIMVRAMVFMAQSFSRVLSGILAGEGGSRYVEQGRFQPAFLSCQRGLATG